MINQIFNDVLRKSIKQILPRGSPKHPDTILNKPGLLEACRVGHIPPTESISAPPT
jgi:hypothetical protein